MGQGGCGRWQWRALMEECFESFPFKECRDSCKDKTPHDQHLYTEIHVPPLSQPAAPPTPPPPPRPPLKYWNVLYPAIPLITHTYFTPLSFLLVSRGYFTNWETPVHHRWSCLTILLNLHKHPVHSLILAAVPSPCSCSKIHTHNYSSSTSHAPSPKSLIHQMINILHRCSDCSNIPSFILTIPHLNTSYIVSPHTPLTPTSP